MKLDWVSGQNRIYCLPLAGLVQHIHFGKVMVHGYGTRLRQTTLVENEKTWKPY
jgi:hypothetical protein